MGELTEFFAGLFDTSLWPARWHCGTWTDFHGWTYIISDLMIWFAYFAIPVIILSYIYKKQYELKYTKTYFLFAAFILLCGSTHLLDAAMFWTPMYRFNALIRFITGATSLFTVYHLIQILPTVFKEKTSVVLQLEIDKRMEAERKLAEANEGLQAFAYMASHDLQEPLRKMKIFTSQVFDANASHFDETSTKLLEKTIGTATRMEKIIKDILQLSSINEQAEFAEVDLSKVIDQAKSDMEVKISALNAVIETKDLPKFYGQEDYLIQLFSNLISNSLKFSKNAPLIRITGEVTESKIKILFQDNGIGMKQELTGKIFQPFQRLHSKNSFEGSGIGLAICKKIMDIHGGSIAVESVEGTGSTFIMEFPKK